MANLEPIPNTELTDYVVQLLSKHEIRTVQEFLDADLINLTKILHISEKDLIQMKDQLREHCVLRLNLVKYCKIVKDSMQSFRTGIKGLDAMLKFEEFATSRVLEICGIASIGKSQICHTIALNFVSSDVSGAAEREALYIDTKYDFSATRIGQMLASRNITEAAGERNMRRIKVERTLTAEGVIEILEELLSQLKAQSADVTNIKFVIIDSLPAVWLVLNNEDDYAQAKHLLTKLKNLIYQIAIQHSITFMLVNLLLPEDSFKSRDDVILSGEMAANDEEDEQLADASSQPPIIDKEPSLRPALGLYWHFAPKIRLLLAMPENTAADNDARFIKIIKSVWRNSGDVCQVHITDAGVV